jgi:Peptidase of plants and bacteria
MKRSFRLVLVLLIVRYAASVASSAPVTKPAEPAVTATVETTLSTAAGHIRQFAFDGDADTYFASAQNARSSDHFTLVFHKPVAVQSIAVTTGRPGGGDRLDAGTLETSADGKTFEPQMQFAAGLAGVKPEGKPIKAIRVRPSTDLKHPLAIREFTIESEPAVAVFKYPVEFIVNVDEAPDMKAWAEQVARICERAYPMINEELQSAGFRPRHVITMTWKRDYKGVAETSGDRITGSVSYFKSHPGDVGAMVHETVHCVQSYGGRGNPGWLVEGIADYIRFFKFEPGRLRPLNPDRARYNGSYQVTAAFLAYVTEKYDKELVRKLNALVRQGKYKEDAWKQLTGKSAPELNEEWKESLRRRATPH